MANSQNGWSANSNKAAIGIITPSVAGVDFPQGVRGGDVATVLVYVAEQFHNKVEPLHDGWCWGYFYKQIEGSSSLSNHASGTALDFNAPKHPMGSRDTFTPAQVLEIRKILSFCGGVVRWGGDYSGRKDEMHFEINAGQDAVAQLAAKIKGIQSPPPVPPASAHVLKEGDNGQEVLHIQDFLRRVFPAYRNSVSVKRGIVISVDGDFGPQTTAWIKEFQKRVGIEVDGRVGPVTFSKLRAHGYAF